MVRDLLEERRAPGGARREPARLPYFDNVRAALMALVVLGHLLFGVEQKDELAHVLVLSIYAFHMPAFFFVAGVFAKAERTRGRVTALASRLLLPYLIWESAFLVMNRLAHAQNPGETLLRPSYMMWFLLSLFTLQMALPYLARWRWALPASVGLALVAGYVPSVGPFLSLSRTLVFLPFFLAGQRLGPGVVLRLRSPRARTLAPLGLLALLLGMAVFSAHLNFRWMFEVSPYASLGHPEPAAALLRAGLMALALVAGACFLALIPERETPLTEIGARTLYVYLLHAAVVWVLTRAGFFDPLDLPNDVPYLIALALSMTWLLARAPVVRAFRPLVEPRVTLAWPRFGRSTASLLRSARRSRTA